MVVRVKFKGLKIANARGKYYVYRRETGEPLIKGFVGSRAELLQKLEDPEFIQVYNRPRLLKRRAGDFPIETLGGFIHWYTCGAIDDAKESEVDGYPKWWKLANTREVADLIGDESERMGAHYTRHVEAEQNIIRAFSRIKDRQDRT
jgi:hypothetical protein